MHTPEEISAALEEAQKVAIEREGRGSELSSLETLYYKVNAGKVIILPVGSSTHGGKLEELQKERAELVAMVALEVLGMEYSSAIFEISSAARIEKSASPEVLIQRVLEARKLATEDGTIYTRVAEARKAITRTATSG